ncbi:hypothetical protein YC2023_007233 [Brassica napus]
MASLVPPSPTLSLDCGFKSSMVFPVALDEISGLSSMKLSVGKSLVMKTGTVVFAPACSGETSGRSSFSPANLDVWGTDVVIG